LLTYSLNEHITAELTVGRTGSQAAGEQLEMLAPVALLCTKANQNWSMWAGHWKTVGGWDPQLRAHV